MRLKGGRTFLWASPFFGLTDEYVVSTYQQIFECERFDFYTLYTMPVGRRNFYFRYAMKRNEDEKRAMEKSRGVNEGTPVSQKELATVPSFVASQASVR